MSDTEKLKRLLKGLEWISDNWSHAASVSYIGNPERASAFRRCSDEISDIIDRFSDIEEE